VCQGLADAVLHVEYAQQWHRGLAESIRERLLDRLQAVRPQVPEDRVQI